MSVTDWMEWAWSGNWNQSGYEVPTCPWQLPVWQPPLPSACYAGDVVGAPPSASRYPWAKPQCVRQVFGVGDRNKRARLHHNGRVYAGVAEPDLPMPTLGEGWVIVNGEWLLQSFGPGPRGPGTVPLGPPFRFDAQAPPGWGGGGSFTPVSMIELDPTACPETGRFPDTPSATCAANRLRQWMREQQVPGTVRLRYYDEDSVRLVVDTPYPDRVPAAIAGWPIHREPLGEAVSTVGAPRYDEDRCVTYSFAAHEVTRAQHVLRLRRTPHAWRPYPHGGGATAFVPVGWLMFMKGEAERLPAAFRAAGLNPGMVLSTSPCPDDAPRFQDTVGGDCCIPAYDWGISTDFPVNLPPNRNVTYVRPRYLPAFADPTAVAQYTCAGPVSGEAWFVPGGTAPDTRELPPRYLAGAATLATRILRGQVVTAGNRGILQRRFPGVRFDVETGYSCHTEERRINTVRICVDRRGRFLSAQVG